MKFFKQTGKKRVFILLTTCILLAGVASFLLLTGTFSTMAYLISGRRDKPSDISFPDVQCPPVEAAYASLEEAQAAGGGWYATMIESFEGDELPWPWFASPHGLRNTEYWCDNLIDASEDGKVKVLAFHADDHACEICPAEGDFTSGIETRRIADGVSEQVFEQAFGYYEARVYLPKGPGLWSAFWLQTNSMGQLGNRGKDGSEIDIYESAFHFDPAKMGNCIHWDGYARFYDHYGTVTDTGVNHYDGWQTYGLLWTPESYTFFHNGKAIWQTNAGGVSRVPSFLRLTVEIRRQAFGPYGAKLGEFGNTRENPSVFEIDYVKVYQHTDFLEHIRTPDSFEPLRIPWF